MKILGAVLIGLGFLTIVLAVASGLVYIYRETPETRYRSLYQVFDEIELLLEGGVALLIIGCIVYGIGRAVQELTLIRKLLQRPRL